MKINVGDGVLLHSEVTRIDENEGTITVTIEGKSRSPFAPIQRPSTP